jgi:predicted RNase H-like nuclease (RuvC/YqgF family)
MSKPKRESSVLERIPNTVASEVKDFQKKRGIGTFYEALKFVILADKKWKKVETERKEKIQNDTRKECDGRLKKAVESYVNQVTELKNNIVQKNSEIGKLKWQLNANVANVDKISRLEAQIIEKDSEITQKDSEIVKLKAEIEKGPSPEIMKEHNEMKETIQSLESKLNEAKNKARVLLYDERL